VSTGPVAVLAAAAGGADWLVLGVPCNANATAVTTRGTVRTAVMTTYRFMGHIVAVLHISHLADR
jgi:hypothetical protein